MLPLYEQFRIKCVFLYLETGEIVLWYCVIRPCIENSMSTLLLSFSSVHPKSLTESEFRELRVTKLRNIETSTNKNRYFKFFFCKKLNKRYFCFSFIQSFILLLFFLEVSWQFFLVTFLGALQTHFIFAQNEC